MKKVELKDTINLLVYKWSQMMGLRYGWISTTFHNHFLNLDHPDNTAAYCDTDWRYQDSNIHFNISQLKDMVFDRLEMVVVHELMHIFLNEMRYEGLEHEERVATQLQSAFVWVRDLTRDEYKEKTNDSKKRTRSNKQRDTAKRVAER